MAELDLQELPIEKLVPHSGDMIFLKRILRVGPKFIECLADFRSPLFQKMFPSDVPTWVGLELMAQTVAAYAGYWAQHANRTAVLGFLLGTKHYKCLHPCFDPTKSYAVNANMISLESGLASFESHIQSIESGELVAKADLRVYSPDDVDDFLKPKLNQRGQ